MGEPIPVWSERYRVRSYEMDASAELSLPGVCNWLQESAGNHAAHLGWSMGRLADEGLTWVLSRLRLRIGALPRWGDEALIETWPSGVDRLFSLREFRLVSATGEILAEAATGWLLIDVRRRRPKRPPDAIGELAARTPGGVFEDGFADLPEVADALPSRSYVVRFGEVDINRHVNNVAIVAWVQESLDREMLVHHRPAAVDVEFRGEAVLGDTVDAVVGGAEGTYLHRLERRGDGREIARARTAWRSR